MKVLLTKSATVKLKAGEVAEISPDQAKYLIMVGAAEIVTEREASEKKRVTRKK